MVDWNLNGTKKLEIKGVMYSIVLSNKLRNKILKHLTFSNLLLFHSSVQPNYLQ